MTWSGAAAWIHLGKLPGLASYLSLDRALLSHNASLISCSRDPSPEPSAKRAREDAPTLSEPTSKRLHGAPSVELRLPAMGNSLFLQFIPTSLAGIALLGLKLAICSMCRCCVRPGCWRPSGKAPCNHHHHANRCTLFAQLCQLFFFLAHFLPVPSLVASSDN
jgi:hypothetical protein